MLPFKESEINQKSIDFLKSLLVDDPENINARIQLAGLYLQIEDYQKAKIQLDFVLKIDPNNFHALEIKQKLEAEKLQVNIPKTSDQGQEFLEIKQVPKSDLNYLSEKPKLLFDQVGGMEELKEEIKLGIIYPFQKSELYKKYGKKVGGGILLYGPPGCGKTLIARATAGEIQAHFISIGIEEILDMYIGQSEKNIHSVFTEARRNTPAVVFFDEVDALSADRMKSGNQTAFVNQFLTEMDGVDGNNENLMVIGATNAPWQVDPAFKRPGRFDKVIFVPPPDRVARAEIFKLNLQNKPVENIDYFKLAEMTNLFSGADIAKVCDIAVEIVVKEVLSGKDERPVSMKDFEKVIKESNSSVREWFSTAKNFARFANESGNYSAISDFIAKNKVDI